ncbi:MAG: type IV pilus secretin family protein, partial [Nitrospirae bacterium]
SIEETDYGLRIGTTGRIDYTITKPNDPFRLFVDLRGIAPGNMPKKLTLSGTGVASEVDIEEVKLPVEATRLNLLLSSPAEVNPTVDGGTLMLAFKVNGTDEANSTPVSAVTAVEPAPEPDTGVTEMQDTGNTLPPAQYLESISMEMLRDALQVTLKGDGSMIPDVFPLDNRLVIDIPDVAMRAEIPHEVIKPLKGIRWGEHDTKLRVVLDLESNTAFDVVSIGDEVRVKLRSAGLLAKSMETQQEVPKKEITKAPAVQESPKATDVTPEALTEGRYSGKRISLDFQDADIVPIFRLIADVSGYNIVVDPQVKGKVTMKLVNVPWDQALDLILKSNKLDKVVEGNIIRIAPVSVLAKEQEERAKKIAASRKAEPLVTKVFPISYADVKNVQKSIDSAKILSERGSISVDERISSIIVKDVESNMPKVEELIKTLDKPTPQVLIEARIVEVNTAAKNEFGIKWGLSTHTYDKTLSLGGLTPFIVDFPSGAGPGSGSGINFGFINPAGTLKLDLEIGALQNSGKLKIVSNPRIITVDNEEAFISQGKSIPVRKLTSEGTVSTEFKDVKLELKVKPHITPDNSVILNVEAKKEEIDPTVPSVEGVPGTDKKEAKTNVIVKDGETLVIGGIYKTFDNDSATGVPGAMDVPILGWLFKKKQKEFNTNELLIFITPRIVTQPPKE